MVPDSALSRMSSNPDVDTVSFGLRIVFHEGASLSDGQRLGSLQPPGLKCSPTFLAGTPSALMNFFRACALAAKTSAPQRAFSLNTSLSRVHAEKSKRRPAIEGGARRGTVRWSIGDRRSAAGVPAPRARTDRYGARCRAAKSPLHTIAGTCRSAAS